MSQADLLDEKKRLGLKRTILCSFLVKTTKSGN
jgi:hypothetical protein